MRKSDIKKVLLILLVVGFISLVLMASIRIVKSTSWVRDRRVKSGVETSSTEDEGLQEETKPREEMELAEEGSTEEYQLVKNVYSLDEDVDLEAKEYLGEDYDRYKGVINLIISNFDAIMAQIPEGKGLGSSGIKMYGDGYSDSLDLDTGMEDVEGFFIEKSLTIIYYFDSTKVIYAYDYPNSDGNELVVLDYAGIERNTSNMSVLKIGDVMSLSGNTSRTRIQKFGDFYVLFVRW